MLLVLPALVVDPILSENRRKPLLLAPIRCNTCPSGYSLRSLKCMRNHSHSDFHCTYSRAKRGLKMSEAGERQAVLHGTPGAAKRHSQRMSRHVADTWPTVRERPCERIPADISAVTSVPLREGSRKHLLTEPSEANSARHFPQISKHSRRCCGAKITKRS